MAIALPAGLDFVCALHACLLLGAVAVPVDLRLGERERAVIVDGAAVVVDEPLRAAGARGIPAGATHDLDSVAAVIHTSGTTSTSKPVELTYGNFLWSALGSAVALGLDPHERWLCNLPLSHVGGLSILLRSAIYATTAVVHERFDTELTLRAVMGERGRGVPSVEPLANGAETAGASPEAPVTLVSLVATTLTRLLDAGLERPPTLRCALTGGGPVPAALLERARVAGVPVSLTYGMTEACSQVTTLPPKPGDTRLRRWPIRLAAIDHLSTQTPAATTTAGPPLFCTRVRTAPDGEIEVAGPTIARGVAGEDGWLRTGDVGRLNGEGNLVVTGRKADTIVSGGRTWRRPRWRPCSKSTPACSRRRRSAVPTSAGARRSPRSSLCATVPNHMARSCARIAPRAWLRTRFQRKWRWWRDRCHARDRASCCEGSCDEG